MKSASLKITLFTLALFAFSFSQAQQKERPTPEKMFASLDTDEDGKVTLEEFKAKKRRNEVKPEILEKRYKAMDKNEDGSVNLEEFKKAMENGKKNRNNKPK